MGIEFRALAITVVLAAALYYTYGQFSLPWITTLPVVLALAFFALPTPKWFAHHASSISLAVILGFLTVAGVSLLPTHDFLRSVIVDVAITEYLPWMRVLFALAGVSVVALFLSSRSERWARISTIFFGFALAFLIGAYALIVPSSPNAQIDVWTVHEEGTQAFIDGKNPYAVEYTNIYPENLRPILTPNGVAASYLPGVFIWMSPWKAMGLDTRYSQLLTRLCTALLLFLIARRTRRDFMAYVPSLLFITFPLTTFFIVRAWNDDMAMMGYALAAYAVVSRRPWVFFVATNFLFLHKQYVIFFAPVLIWFAWREWRDKWVWLKGTLVAGLVCVGYLVADWRNFLGSQYGLGFLKGSSTASFFMERRDPFSLMNYLQLYAGFKSNWFFVLVPLAVTAVIVRKNWQKPDAASVFRGLGASCVAMFMFAPAAFANYYQFALGLILIGWACSRPQTTDGWEFRTRWWTLGFVLSRSIILFNFSSLIVETRAFENIASLIHDGKWPYFDFGYSGSPLSLIPALFAGEVSRRSSLHDFLAFQTLFQLAMLACDVAVGWCVLKRAERGRSSQLALGFFVFGPLFIAPLWSTSGVLATAAAAWLALQWFERKPRSFVADSFDARKEALGVLAIGVAMATLFWLIDLAGFDLGFHPLKSPIFILIWILCLVPLCPPMRPVAFRKWSFPAFAVALSGALAFGSVVLWQIDETYNAGFTVWIYALSFSILLSLIFLGLSLRKVPSA